MVNALAECCFSPYKKVALAAAAFMLGNCTPLVEDDNSSSDEDEAQPHAPIGAKKTKGRARQLKREQEAVARKKERKERRQNGKILLFPLFRISSSQ